MLALIVAMRWANSARSLSSSRLQNGFEMRKLTAQRFVLVRRAALRHPVGSSERMWRGCDPADTIHCMTLSCCCGVSNGAR